MAALVCLDAHRGMELQKLAALCLGAGDLFVLCRHVGHTAPVEDGDLLGCAPHRRTRHIHGHVPAAYDRHALSGEVRGVAVAHRTQHLHRTDDASRVLARKSQPIVAVGADGQVDRIEAVAQRAQVFDGALKLHVDAAV